ncbi:MAG: hypothetical protein IT176_06585 [Acidobacteria bacterium]|nr:hypothetical protein [Acidobacteriota bacterium]
MAGIPTADAVRHEHGTLPAVLFVVCLCAAAAVLLFLSVPLPWAILAAIVLAAVAARLIRDIHGNRAL